MASTIYDLAEAAGVSIATVSRALNDHFAVSEKTKESVMELVQKIEIIAGQYALLSYNCIEMVDRFDWKRIADKYKEIYSGIVKEKVNA